MLLVRDFLLAGARRYSDLLAAPERIPTNILADRLKRLEAAGLIESRVYNERPRRYEYVLTPRGRALGPIVGAMSEWGLRHVPGTQRRAPGERG